MTHHRFRDHLRALTSVRVPAATCATSALPETASGFVPCPIAALGICVQPTQVMEIYRLAAERTQQQLQSRLPRHRSFAFSRN